MANTKSARKNIRKSGKRTEANKTVRSTLKTLQKKVASLAQANDTEQLKTTVKEYMSELDRAVKKNVIHRNKASRQKAATSKYLAA